MKKRLICLLACLLTGILFSGALAATDDAILYNDIPWETNIVEAIQAIFPTYDAETRTCAEEDNVSTFYVIDFGTTGAKMHCYNNAEGKYCGKHILNAGSGYEILLGEGGEMLGYPCEMLAITSLPALDETGKVIDDDNSEIFVGISFYLTLTEGREAAWDDLYTQMTEQYGEPDGFSAEKHAAQWFGADSFLLIRYGANDTIEVSYMESPLCDLIKARK